MKRIILFFLLAFSNLGYSVTDEIKKISIYYQAKDYSHLLGMSGFSDTLLKMHFELYQGYVRNVNLLITKLREWSLQDKASSYEYSALKRRISWEFDGMRLHEFYFENLGGKDVIDKNSHFYQRILKDFGSYERWKADFVATGLTRGIGWVVLYRDPMSGQLFNTWIGEHDLGHLAGGNLLLVMDVWEHAYITQYALDRAKYINIFFENISWKTVLDRYAQSLKG